MFCIWRWVIMGLLLVSCVKMQAQDVISIVAGVAQKVVMAIDLGVQTAQTQTIKLQIAEKSLENAMQLDELTDIASWLQQQKDLYGEYYQELWQVKNAISAYERIKQMITEESQIVAQSKQMSTILGSDKHFTTAEVTAMTNILSGILTESANNVKQIELVINAFVTQMADADRLRIIDGAGHSIDKNFTDMQQFYERNSLLSLEWVQGMNDVEATKALYGLP